MTSRRWTLVVLALASCVHYEETRLPTFDAAMALATSTSPPAFYDVSQVPNDLPIAAPFAQLARAFPHQYDTAEQGWYLNEECAAREFRPDFVVFHARGLASGGTRAQASPVFGAGGFYGIGISSTPVLLKACAVVCYRLAPVGLGLTADTNAMVTHVDDSARASGLQEGDSLQVIDGAPVRPKTPQEVPPWLGAMLQRKPGDVIELEWIRPGTGRMHGRLTLTGPQPMPADAKPVPKPWLVW